MSRHPVGPGEYNLTSPPPSGGDGRIQLREENPRRKKEKKEEKKIRRKRGRKMGKGEKKREKSGERKKKLY